MSDSKSKNSNKIDPNWHKLGVHSFALRPFLVAGVMLFILAIAILLSFYTGKTPLGAIAKQDVFSPAKEKSGFISKSNKLLAELLADVDTSVKAVDLESLNKKYPSLIFDLPYASDNATCIEGGDLRLVGINHDRIKKKWKKFYFNSRLKQLLQSQSDNISETYFSINLSTKVERGKSELDVISIKLIPQMFRVALTKDPWTGTIIANENGLFNDSNSVYLTYGNTVLPLRRNRNAVMWKPQKVYAIDNELKLNRSDRHHFDYYRYYKQNYSTDRSVSICFTQHRSGDVNICCVGDTLVISSSYTFNYGKGKVHSGPNVRIPVRDGEKMVFYDSSNKKLAEFTINTSNPSRVLSSIIHTNIGTSRYTIARSQTDLFTQQLLRGLSRNLSNKDNVNNVNITIDPLLSKEFEDELIDYIDNTVKRIGHSPRQKNNEYDISLTIMDLATGNVLASPFYMTRFEKELKDESLQLITKNVALRRRYLGSTFKPMLALAAVLTNPDLLSLNTTGMCSLSDDDSAIFHGRKCNAWAKSHWGGTSFVNFLAFSHDVYPVSLAAIAMSQATGNYATLSLGEKSAFCLKNGMLTIKKEELNKNTPFIDWLSKLYDANYDSDSSTDLRLYEGLFDTEEEVDPFCDKASMQEERNFGLDEISPDITNLHIDLLHAGGPFMPTLVPFVLGQGSNEWNCIKLAEAWSRMISKRDVRAHLIKSATTTNLIFSGHEEERPSVRGNRTTSQVSNTWNQFLQKFESAQGIEGGTLYRMYNSVNHLNQSTGSNLVLFSKTGTPDAYMRNEFPLLMSKRRHLDLGMYTFVLTERSELDKIKENKPGKGIVCVLRINRSYTNTCRHCRGNEQCNYCKQFNGLSSTHARNFFSNNEFRLRKLYDMTKNYY